MWYLDCATSLRIVRAVCVTVYLYAQLSIVGRPPHPSNWVTQFVAKLHNVLLWILIMYFDRESEPHNENPDSRRRV